MFINNKSFTVLSLFVIFIFFQSLIDNDEWKFSSLYQIQPVNTEPSNR